MRRTPFVLLVCLCASVVAAQTVVLEDFESGAPALGSWSDQDHAPDAWSLETDAFEGGACLVLDGNTWKTQPIAAQALTDSTVWRVAVRCDDRAEMQAFGLSDGANSLFYTFFGTELPASPEWFTVYQGAFPRYEWRAFLLPVGRDWLSLHGSLPQIDTLVYVNDADAESGAVRFDAVADVTLDRPRAPTARILYTVESQRKVSEKTWKLDVAFRGEVFDPDSATHDWRWDFGDGATSAERHPTHSFLVEADHPFTVGLRVTDPDGYAGGDTCQVAVAPGPATGPITVNFVGDVFTGRGYENWGGLIDTHGVEALFTPTLDIFGRAADVNVANLEVAYTDRGTPHPTKSVVFRSEPQNIAGLTHAGIDVVTIGSNHIVDYGEIGMLDTIDGLEQLGIAYSGAGSSEYLALLPAFHTERGVRLGFLGLCDRTGRQWNYQPFLDAGYDKPGFAHLLPVNLESSIGYTRPLSDIVIVQTHSGDEYETAPPDKGLAEAAAVEAGDADFEFRNEPSPGERALRRMALDLGADVVINHHPHVLQGFESYDGKLIAHSLGNFVFDLYYTETMPTLVLTLEIEKSGITGYRFTPAWINHWIPEPATGNLGREIVGRLAEYSRPMGAVVVPLPESDEARIHLSRAELDSTRVPDQVVVPLFERDGRAVSAPLELAGKGSLSAVEALGAGWEARWGRELLWLGGFEDEGSDLWDDNTDDEELVADVARTGARSLRLRRLSSASGQTGTDLEKHLPCDGAREHSAVAWLRAENASQARVMARFYDTRYSESPLSSTDLAPRLDGDTNWVRQWVDLDTPANAGYFELRCGHEPPAAGTGWSWYDDLAFIEWEPWTSAGADLKVPAPNNVRFLQVRAPDAGAVEATVRYDETRYAGAVTAALDPPPAAPAGPALRCFPNPFNPRVTVELDLRALAAAPNATVEVFDLRGHKVRTLHRGPLDGGLRHGLTWDGRDDARRALASGAYLVRARAGGRSVSGKVVLVR